MYKKTSNITKQRKLHVYTLKIQADWLFLPEQKDSLMMQDRKQLSCKFGTDLQMTFQQFNDEYLKLSRTFIRYFTIFR